jgi:hypothetical protein
MTESSNISFFAANEASRRIDNSTVLMRDLISGSLSRNAIDIAFSGEGCGATLIALDDSWNDFYEEYYLTQWQLGHRVFESDSAKRLLESRFVSLDLPLRLLLCRCGVAVVRTRSGIAGSFRLTENDLTKFGCDLPLTYKVGRPLAANRTEFHPCVDWLIEQERSHTIQTDNDTALMVVGHDTNGSEIIGRSYADETRLLALYREWQDASPEDRGGHGNKYNGDVYYGAYRGRMHVDCGSTLTVLFGPGELRDRAGHAPDGTINPSKLGGTLEVATPGGQEATSLPPRLPSGSAYVVVFFEEANLSSADSLLNAKDLGWAPTLHGVQRLFDTRFSRGQAVMHVRISSNIYINEVVR